MVIYHSMFLVHGVPTEVNGHLSLNVPGTRCSHWSQLVHGVPTEVNGHLSLNVPGTRCSYWGQWSFITQCSWYTVFPYSINNLSINS